MNFIPRRVQVAFNVDFQAFYRAKPLIKIQMAASSKDKRRNSSKVHGYQSYFVGLDGG